MGKFGFLSALPRYFLKPLMTHLRSGDLHAMKGGSALTGADCRCVMYNLIVFGWILLMLPSHVTHSSRAVCDAGRTDPSVFLNCRCRAMKSVNDFCPVL